MHGTKFSMNGRTNGKKQRPVSNINLTSMVDVCLTLVIIFMVSYPLVMQSGIKVSSPSMKKAKVFRIYSQAFAVRATCGTMSLWVNPCFE